MKFIALGSLQSLEKFKMHPECLGCINADNPNNLLSLNIYNIPANVKSIFVELSPLCIPFMAAYFKVLQTRQIIFFEVIDDAVQINPELIDTYNSIAKEYHQVQQQTQGLISFSDASAIVLSSLIHLYKQNLPQVFALEVGSWTGCSAYFLVKAINSLSSTKGTLFCMDTWQGNQYPGYEIAKQIDIFTKFKDYMTGYGLYDFIKPIIADSKIGFEIMKKDFFDIIFIDGDHRYDSAYADIMNAIKKLKSGGLLLGHDGNGYADNLPLDFLMSNLDKDCAFYEGTQYSCGVLKALRDLLGNDYTVFSGTATWYKNITAEDKKRINLLA